MALQSFNERGLSSKISLSDDIQLNTDLDNMLCPICLDFPHNSVLLQCSSYDKGCRPFVCDTDHLHSNCLDRFKNAYGMTNPSKSNVIISSSTEIAVSESCSNSCCPLCRGDVTGWVIVDKVRSRLDQKKRFCEEERCAFKGTFSELQAHAKLEHPHARPSKIDSARLLDWENFQQSSEIIDVLTTIHSEVPRGVVLGDYVIEYGDESRDEFEDFRGNREGSWCTSCILYQVFDNFRNSRNRRRSRVGNTRRGSSHQPGFGTWNSDERSIVSIELDYGIDENEEEVIRTPRRGFSRGSSNLPSSQRRRNRFTYI